ncbi:paraneoplastic antigen-like protein 8A isoform X2 [Sorex araneus]|nr:paraneoplastic antigen-like protein 8A isoform X2 [Sorex araneus]XP_055001428.1 paraneoplastic antigen-like protein 8A isoform X2 [Sorex araneus]
MLMHLLEDWCRGMEVDMRRALLVTGIPEDCGQAEIEDTLHSVLAPLGSFAVLNRIFVRQQNAKAALVEVGEGVSLSAVPREVPGRGGTWRVLCRDPAQDAEFLRNLNKFLDAEGRTWEDVGRLLQLHQPAPSQYQPPENWAEALGVLLGAVVQIVFYVDAEMRACGEERARAAATVAAAAAAAAAAQAGRKGKKERGSAETAAAAAVAVAQESPAVKKEQPDPRDGAPEEGELPRVEGHKASAKTRSRKKKQKKTPKEEGTAPTPSGKVEAGGKGEAPKEKGPSEPCVKQEVVEEPPSQASSCHPGAAQAAAGNPGVASESEQNGGLDGPPKKKAMGWAEDQSPVSTGKAGCVSAISRPLANLGDPKKKPAAPKSEPKSKREAAGQKDPPPSTTHSSKAKPDSIRACSASRKR